MLYFLPAARPGSSCAAPHATLPTSSPSCLPALLRPFPTLFLLASVLFLSMSREFPAWLPASTFGQKAAILEGDVISHPLCRGPAPWLPEPREGAGGWGCSHPTPSAGKALERWHIVGVKSKGFGSTQPQIQTPALLRESRGTLGQLFCSALFLSSVKW